MIVVFCCSNHHMPDGSRNAANVIKEKRCSVWTNYDQTTSIALGYAHIVVGTLCIIVNIIAIIIHSFLGLVGAGIWGGVFVSVI